MALPEKALDYIISIITENEEVKKFPKDFVTASMQWIRTWFLTDDPVTTSIVENKALPEAVKKPVIAAKLESLKANPDFMKALETQLQAFAEHKARLKNVVVDSDIDVAGSVHIGDKGGALGDGYDEKNVVKGGTIKAGGIFGWGMMRGRDGTQMTQKRHRFKRIKKSYKNLFYTMIRRVLVIDYD